MNKLFAIVSALLVSASPSLAMSVEERQQHVGLVQSLENVNVSVLVNEPKHCVTDGPNKYYGAFIPSERLVIICQTNKTVMDGDVVPFSLEDLDTLRHEAHHVVQDCLDGKLDGYMITLFEEDQLNMFLANFPQEYVDNVKRVYGEWGASPEDIMLELEAFAVAAEVPASTISSAVTKFCTGK